MRRLAKRTRWLLSLRSQLRIVQAKSHNAVEVLKQVITCGGKPRSILSEDGLQFYVVEADTGEK